MNNFYVLRYYEGKMNLGKEQKLLEVYNSEGQLAEMAIYNHTVVFEVLENMGFDIKNDKFHFLNFDKITKKQFENKLRYYSHTDKPIFMMNI